MGTGFVLGMVSCFGCRYFVVMVTQHSECI